MPGGQALAHRLERWATGSLAAIFSADAAVAARSSGCSSSGSRRSAIRRSATSPSSPRSASCGMPCGRDLKPKLVVVDEAWKVMRQPSGADFVEELARSARHYHAGLQLATQDIAEFLRSDYGEAIVKQCDIRVLLGQTPEGVEAHRPVLRSDRGRAPLAAPCPTRRGPPLRRAQPRRLRGHGSASASTNGSPPVQPTWSASPT